MPEFKLQVKSLILHTISVNADSIDDAIAIVDDLVSESSESSGSHLGVVEVRLIPRFGIGDTVVLKSDIDDLALLSGMTGRVIGIEENLAGFPEYTLKVIFDDSRIIVDPRLAECVDVVT